MALYVNKPDVGIDDKINESKLWEQTKLSVRLCVTYFNWSWRHSCLGTTAAQRAELAERPWTWNEIATYPTLLSSTIFHAFLTHDHQQVVTTPIKKSVCRTTTTWIYHLLYEKLHLVYTYLKVGFKPLVLFKFYKIIVWVYICFTQELSFPS
jgi:hypothetical protein